jgi:hypothetical protein
MSALSSYIRHSLGLIEMLFANIRVARLERSSFLASFGHRCTGWQALAYVIIP